MKNKFLMPCLDTFTILFLKIKIPIAHIQVQEEYSHQYPPKIKIKNKKKLKKKIPLVPKTQLRTHFCCNTFIVQIVEKHNSI